MRARTVFCTLVFLAVPAIANANDGPAVWQAVQQAAFDPAKTAQISGLTLTRDRIQITLNGVIQFTTPANSVVYGAAFRGTGQVRVVAPNPIEGQQLKLHAGSEEVFDAAFTEAVFSFTDATFEEVSARAQWSGAADATLAALYRERQDNRESYGAEVLPRLVKGLLSQNKKQTEFFYAELKTDKDWIVARMDALNPEEVMLGRWTTIGENRFIYRITETWMSFPRGNRSSSQAWSNPVAREDLLPKDYRIDATVTGGADLTVKTSVDFTPQWSGERAVRFLLDSNLRVTSVALAGAALPFVQPQERRDRLQSYGDYVVVFFPEPLVEGQSYSLDFAYGGRRVVRQMGTGVYFCQSFGWYPTRQNFAMRANFEITFRSPKQYTLVATGVKISDDTSGREAVSVWKSEKPIAVAGFAYGDVKIERTTVGGIEVEVHANKNADDMMKNLARTAPPGAMVGDLTPAGMAGQIATEMGNSIRLLEAYFGPYPYKRLAVSTIPFSYGQGWPSLIFLSALSFMDSTQRHQFGFNQRAQRDLTDFFRAHETSHQWWGHRVSWKSYHDQWLSEGFAEFSGNLYVQKRGSNSDYLDRLKQARERFQLKDDKGHTYDSVGPIWMGLRLSSSQSPQAYSRLVYEKGGFVLHMLRMMMIDPRAPDPEGRFKSMMKDFTQTFDNGAASTEDFKAIAEKYMIPDMNLDRNGRLGWFFDQYVYGTGLPTYDFQYTLTEAGPGQWKLSGTVTQSGVPRGWKDVLPLYVEVNKNVFRVGTINVTEPVVKFEEVLPVKPARVALCLNEDTIGIIKQP